MELTDHGSVGKRAPRVALCWMGRPIPGGGATIVSFEERLRAHGLLLGQDLLFESFYVEPWDQQLPAVAKSLVQKHFDAIVTTSTPLALALQQATAVVEAERPVRARTPIIMTTDDGDCVGAGLVASLDRPAGNVTGLTSEFSRLCRKRLELLAAVRPGLARVAVVWNPTVPDKRLDWQETTAGAEELGIHLQSLEITEPADIPDAFARAHAAAAEGLLTLGDGLTFRRRRQLVALAAEHRLPAIYEHRAFVDLGGLMSYGPNMLDLYANAATYLVRVLQGESPADLPVGRPDHFDLVVNLMTANNLSLTFPPSILADAIEGGLQ